jgi:hypothetical protein
LGADVFQGQQERRKVLFVFSDERDPTHAKTNTTKPLAYRGLGRRSGVLFSAEKGRLAVEDFVLKGPEIALASSVLIPGVISIVGFYVKINAWQSAQATSNAVQTAAIKSLEVAITGLKEETATDSKETHSRIGRLHDRVSLNEAAVAELKGWREAQ